MLSQTGMKRKGLFAQQLEKKLVGRTEALPGKVPQLSLEELHFCKQESGKLILSQEQRLRHKFLGQFSTVILE